MTGGPFSAYTTLSCDLDGEVLRVWLDRPDKLNALSTVTLREVGDLFASLEHEHEIGVVVLGGRGRSFCAGADRSPAPDPSRPSTERGKRWFANLGRRACRAIEDCPIPTVARVHGHAVGGGMCFAASCDFRITTEDAQWFLPEIELGLPMTWAAIPRLAQEIGTARARQMVMLCDRITGATAEQWGLAHQSVTVEQLDEAVEQWVNRVLAMPALAVHMTKTTFRGYSRLHALGDASEADADLLTLAQLDPAVAANFAPRT